MFMGPYLILPKMSIDVNVVLEEVLTLSQYLYNGALSHCGHLGQYQDAKRISGQLITCSDIYQVLGDSY